MKWLVIIVLLVLLLLAIFLPDRGLAIPALGTSAYHAAAHAKLVDENQRRRSRLPASALGDALVLATVNIRAETNELLGVLTSR